MNKLERLITIIEDSNEIGEDDKEQIVKILKSNGSWDDKLKKVYLVWELGKDIFEQFF